MTTPIIRYKDESGTEWTEPFESLEHSDKRWRVNGRNSTREQYEIVLYALEKNSPYLDCVKYSGMMGC